MGQINFVESWGGGGGGGSGRVAYSYKGDWNRPKLRLDRVRNMRRGVG